MDEIDTTQVPRSPTATKWVGVERWTRRELVLINKINELIKIIKTFQQHYES